MRDPAIELGRRIRPALLAELIHDTRTLIGWTQRDLAARAETSQATIWRLETGRVTSVDMAVVERVLAALGLRARIEIDGRHLDDRRRQRDPVHARITGHVARRLERAAWVTATEVPIGDGVPRGWIDLLAYRPTDRAMLIEETKGDIPDIGGLQRSLAFYEREALAAARRLGWRPVAAAVVVVALDSTAIARRLSENRDLVTRAFPVPIRDVAAWLASPGQPAPRGWAIGTCDPAARSRTWLLPTMLGARRRPPAYADYADAARRLLRNRRS